MTKRVQGNTLELLVRAIVEKYSLDRTKPSVTISYLPERSTVHSAGSFYASICRYEGPFDQGKRVVLACKAVSFDLVIRELAEKWLASFGLGSATRSLRSHLGGRKCSA